MQYARMKQVLLQEAMQLISAVAILRREIATLVQRAEGVQMHILICFAGIEQICQSKPTSFVGQVIGMEHHHADCVLRLAAEDSVLGSVPDAFLLHKMTQGFWIILYAIAIDIRVHIC